MVCLGVSPPSTRARTAFNMAHCLQEVVVSGSSEDECMHLWDLGTATTLVSYRPAAPGSAAAVAPIGRDFLAIAQNAKASLHVFQVRVRCRTRACARARVLACLRVSPRACLRGQPVRWPGARALTRRLPARQWRRDQPHARMALPERLVAIAATADGVHIAGGADSGRIYLWEACTGVAAL